MSVRETVGGVEPKDEAPTRLRALRRGWQTAGEWTSRRTRDMSTPLADYYVLTYVTLFLVTVGLVMVLSSSSIESLRRTGSAYTEFIGQARLGVVGLVALVIASRMSPRFWKKLTYPFLGVSVLLNALVVIPGLGVEVGGNRNWLAVGPISGQPSELAKLALILTAALTVSRREKHLGDIKMLIGAVVPITAVTIGLVLMQGDLGTALVMLLILAAMLWVSGTPTRFFALAAGAGALGAILLVLTNPNRLRRVELWLTGMGGAGTTDVQGTAWQSVQGQYALASGGVFGLGLGASREKWQWLPAAKDDFIFAILGEELGLFGTIPILLLFAALAISGARLAKRSANLRIKLIVIGITTWVVGQAAINIGVVLGVLPVLGVPLPFMSSGGSALVVTLLAMGVLLSVARSDPAAQHALLTNGLLTRTVAVRFKRLPARSAR